MDSTIVETLSSLMKHIRKEIKTGKVESHVKFEQKDDIFKIITKLKGKNPTTRSWEIPQEDRDTHMNLLSTISKLQKDDPFFKLMEAIRGSRRIHYSDEIWKKNIIYFMGEAYDLDHFVDMRQKAEPLLQDIQVKKKIQNTMSEKREKNIIVQSLYQSLLLKDFMETRDVESYRVLKLLLQPKKIIHSVKKTDGSIQYVADGEPIDGIVEKSYSSLKQYEVNQTKQTDKRVVGLVANWMNYKNRVESLGLNVLVLSKSIVESATHFVIANEANRQALGMGLYEGYMDGNQPKGGNSVRKALSYGQSQIPAVKDGKLYKSMIAAIMSSSIEGLALGEEKEDMLEIELWKEYSKKLVKREDLRDILKQERLVLQQNWSIHESKWKTLLASWKSEGIRPAALHKYGNTLYCADGRLLNIMMKQLESLNHITTSKDEMNHSLLLVWILTHTRWESKIQEISVGVEKTAKKLKMLIQTIYDIRLNRASTDGLDAFVESWVESEPVQWDSESLEQSIRDSGFESPQVSADELVTFVRDYGDGLWKYIEMDVDIEERYGLGVVLGVFLSILHPKLKNHSISNIRLVSGRDRTKEIGSFEVKRTLRDDIRKKMERFGIQEFELPKKESGGATERKDGNEIDDLEIEREDGTNTMTIAIDKGMSMRLL